jgi:hypothetical protein
MMPLYVWGWSCKYIDLPFYLSQVPSPYPIISNMFLSTCTVPLYADEWTSLWSAAWVGSNSGHYIWSLSWICFTFVCSWQNLYKCNIIFFLPKFLYKCAHKIEKKQGNCVLSHVVYNYAMHVMHSTCVTERKKKNPHQCQKKNNTWCVLKVFQGFYGILSKNMFTFFLW